MKLLKQLTYLVQQYAGLIVIWIVVFSATVFLVNIAMQNWLLKN